jgi:hypothetical protein
MDNFIVNNFFERSKVNIPEELVGTTNPERLLVYRDCAYSGRQVQQGVLEER